MNKFKVVVFLGVPVLLLVAVMVLVLTNLGDTWILHLYTTDVPVARGLLMLLIAAGGAALWQLCRWMLPTGLRAFRAHRAYTRAAAPPAPPPVAPH